MQHLRETVRHYPLQCEDAVIFARAVMLSINVSKLIERAIKIKQVIQTIFMFKFLSLLIDLDQDEFQLEFTPSCT